MEEIEDLYTAVGMLEDGEVTDESFTLLLKNLSSLSAECRDSVFEMAVEFLETEMSKKPDIDWTSVDDIIKILAKAMRCLDDKNTIPSNMEVIVPCLLNLIRICKNPKQIEPMVLLMRRIIISLGYFSEEWYAILFEATENDPLLEIFGDLLLLDELPPSEICTQIFEKANTIIQDTIIQEDTDNAYCAVIIIDRMIDRGLEFDYSPIMEHIFQWVDDICTDKPIVNALLSIMGRLKVYNPDFLMKAINIIQKTENFGDTRRDVQRFSQFVLYAGSVSHDIKEDPEVQQIVIDFASAYADNDCYSIKMCSLILLFAALPAYPEYDENLCRIILENFEMNEITTRVAQILIHWIESGSETVLANMLVLMEPYFGQLIDFLDFQESAEAMILGRYISCML